MTSFAHPGSPSGTAPVDPGLAHAHGHQDVTPGEIAAGVIIGRASEYFDFFVFGIACVLVFPYVYFPFLTTLNACWRPLPCSQSPTAHREAETAKAHRG